MAIGDLDGNHVQRHNDTAHGLDEDEDEEEESDQKGHPERFIHSGP